MNFQLNDAYLHGLLTKLEMLVDHNQENEIGQFPEEQLQMNSLELSENSTTPGQSADKGDSHKQSGSKRLFARIVESNESSARRLLNQAVDGFNQATNKVQAMEKLAAKFEAAIRKADYEFADVENSALAMLEENVASFLEGEEATSRSNEQLDFRDAIGNLRTLPSDELTTLQQQLDKYFFQLDENDPARATLAKELEKGHPDLLKAVDVLYEEFKRYRPVFELVQEQLYDLNLARFDRVRTRQVYSEKLGEAGDIQKSIEYGEKSKRLDEQLDKRAKSQMEKLGLRRYYLRALTGAGGQ